MNLTLDQVTDAARKLAGVLVDHGMMGEITTLRPIPRGGVPAAYALQAALTARMGYAAPHLSERAGFSNDTIIVDDIYDSGGTLAPWIDKGYTCAVLVARDGMGIRNPARVHYGLELAGSKDWVVFPWEVYEAGAVADNMVRVLEYLGYDPNSGALRDTPRRMLNWLNEFRADQVLDSSMTTFEDVGSDEMIVVRDIPFVSLCEHHMLPFVGKATIGYIPDKVLAGATGAVLGLSKLARITTWRAKRLQVQERLTTEIRDAVGKAASTSDVGVVITAEHMCMTLRGAHAQGSVTTTSALSGSFREDARTRSEFMALAAGR